MTAHSSSLSLVADIGGTNTRVALASGAEVHGDSIRRFRNADHGGIASVIDAFLGATGIGPDGIGGVCVAAAGPVRAGVAQMTNLDWRIDRDVLARALTADRSAVLNDLQAQGHAIGHIAADDLLTIVGPARHGRHETTLVIGVGTGFNACPVHHVGDQRVIPPSEAGHVALPSSVPGLGAVLAHISAHHGFASVEEILSGRGLSTLHAALHGDTATAAEIMEALANHDAAARETGRVFVEVLGAVAGDLALTHLPFGGIFLVGGVARAFAPWLAEFGFSRAFAGKGRFTDFMDQFTVQVVTDDYAALTGSAAFLARQSSGALPG